MTKEKTLFLFVSFSCFVVRRLCGAAKCCGSTATRTSLRSSRWLVHGEARQYRRIQKELLFATEGALSQVAERKDAQGLIGFLTERGIFFYRWSRQSWATVFLWVCCWGAFHTWRILQRRWDATALARWSFFLPVCWNKSSQGSYSSHNVILAVVEWQEHLIMP